METKQFSLQSPEQIAKDYGGNKQKIAQAASMGMVDPTAAVLAGMFIDRMRSAQMQEQQPQGTVAQQVFQPQQAPQGAPPQGATPPMGAPPMGAPPMGAPPMGAPPPPQPPGMAMGGLMDLSVPDDMFEEPVMDAENFAGGGLVAFAAGGEADDEDEPFRREYKPGERIPFEDSLLGRGLGRVSDTLRGGTPEARAAATRARKEYEASATAAVDYARDRDAYRMQGLAAPLVGGDVPIHPNLRPMSPAPAARDPAYKGPPVTADALRALLTKPGAPARRPSASPSPSPRAAMTAPTAPRGLGALAAPQGVAPRPAATSGAPTAPGAPPAPQAPAGPTGLQGGVEEYMRLQKQYGGDAATPYRDRLVAAAEAQLDPKAMAAQKKQDMWQAVAQFGFNMAATNSPYFMQAAGQAGAATVPFMAASSKERKAAEREALKQLADIEGLTAAEKKQALRDGFAYAARRVEQDEEMDYKRDVLDETKRENRVREGLASRRIEGSGAARSAGTPKFPGGVAGSFAAGKYQEIMAGMEGALQDPRNRAAYNADPEAWVSRYSRRAQQTSLAYGVQMAKGEGGGSGGTRPRERPSGAAATPSSGWGEMTVK